jgi:alpha-1,6-mannosyltransferase
MASLQTSTRARLALGSLVLAYLLVALIAGAPDSPLVPPSPPGVRPVRWTQAWARWIGLDRLTRTGLTVVAIGVLAAILILFFVVVAEARSARVGASLIFVAVALSLAISVAAPLMLSRDVYSYAAYGRIYTVHHANPYVRLPSAFPSDPFVRVVWRGWINTPPVYGPAFVLVSAGVARGTAGSPRVTILAFKLLAAGGVALATALVALAARSLRRRDPGQSARSNPVANAAAAAAAAAVGLNPVVVVHTVGGGHSDALVAASLAGALLLGIRWMNEEKSTRGPFQSIALGITALLTLAGLVKVVLFLVLLVWLWHLARMAAPGRRAGAVGLHVLEAVTISAAFSAPFLTSARAFKSLVTLTSVEGWASPVRLVSRGARVLGTAIDGNVTAEVLDKLVVVGFLAIAAAAFIRFFRRQAEDGRANTPDGLTSALAVGTLGLALAIPYLLPWYAAWFLPFLALVTDPGIAAIGLTAAGLLALTGIPTEAGSTPGLWRGSVFSVHYVVAPMMLGLFLAWVWRTLRLPHQGPPRMDAPPRMADRARP